MAYILKRTCLSKQFMIITASLLAKYRLDCIVIKYATLSQYFGPDAHCQKLSSHRKETLTLKTYHCNVCSFVHSVVVPLLTLEFTQDRKENNENNKKKK